MRFTGGVKWLKALIITSVMAAYIVVARTKCQTVRFTAAQGILQAVCL